MEECKNMKEILTVYEKASGQSINLNKSGIFFSRNTTVERKTAISELLEVTQPLNTGKYLRLPSMIGRNKRAIFSYLRDRLWKRIQSWREKPLSRAGCEVLIKAIGQAIPSYCMSSFLLPCSLADELQKMLNSFWWGSKRDGERSIHWMDWSKMCVSKDQGGMGFRNFYSFNLAMLEKQGWRLISNPDALVSQILKAKYFPRGNFLNARLGQNPSFTWKGIWSSRVLLERGIRLKIDDGTSIQVWSDPWVRDGENFLVETPEIPTLENLKVHELMIPECKEWDTELLEELFLTQNVERISSIPLCQIYSEDKLIWHYTKNEIYSVKSGYRLAENIDDMVELRVPGCWNRIWDLKVQAKVKNLLWRASRNCLPTRLNLKRKRLQIPTACVVCDEEMENTWHIFVTCHFAQNCWPKANLFSIVNQRSLLAESFTEWLLDMISQLSGVELGKFAMVVWNIWRQRNNKLWNNSYLDARTTVFTAMDCLYEWIAARQLLPSMHSANNSSCDLWHRPPTTFMKCNVDATFYEDEPGTGLGMILRDDNGDFVACTSQKIVGRLNVVEGEAIGILEALSWVRNLGMSNVIFEMDAKALVDAIHLNKEDNSEFGTIILCCKWILSSKPLFSVTFARRCANEDAHNLAKSAHSFSNPAVWVEIPHHIGAHVDRLCTYQLHY